MSQLRSNGPYVWVTWLTKLLVGEHSCEWAAWFKSHHESRSWEKALSTFDVVQWQVAHTAGVIDTRAAWEQEGYKVFTEGQNSFALRGKTATLGGKPDLIARKGNEGVILDVKTGRPTPSHGVQVMLYMYATPRALGQYRDIDFDGRVVYHDHEVVIPAAAVDEAFIGNVGRFMQRLGLSVPARRVPSPMECAHCDITAIDCPDRLSSARVTEGFTTDF